MSSFVSRDDIRAEHVERANGEAAVEPGRRELLAEVVGHRLAEVRRARGMTQQQVAEKIGVTKGRISQIEQGKNSGQDVLAPVRRRARWAPTPGDLLRRRRHRRHRVIGSLNTHGRQLIAMHDTPASHLGRGAPVISAS